MIKLTSKIRITCNDCGSRRVWCRATPNDIADVDCGKFFEVEGFDVEVSEDPT